MYGKLNGEDAIEALGDIIEPCSEIFKDNEFKRLFQKNDFKKGEITKNLLKRHKKEIVQILATLDGCSAEKYKCNVLTLPLKVLQLLSDKDVIAFFTSQVPNELIGIFGSSTVGIQEQEKQNTL